MSAFVDEFASDSDYELGPVITRSSEDITSDKDGAAVKCDADVADSSAGGGNHITAGGSDIRDDSDCVVRDSGHSVSKRSFSYSTVSSDTDRDAGTGSDGNAGACDEVPVIHALIKAAAHHLYPGVMLRDVITQYTGTDIPLSPKVLYFGPFFGPKVWQYQDFMRCLNHSAVFRICRGEETGGLDTLQMVFGVYHKCESVTAPPLQPPTHPLPEWQETAPPCVVGIDVTGLNRTFVKWQVESEIIDVMNNYMATRRTPADKCAVQSIINEVRETLEIHVVPVRKEDCGSGPGSKSGSTQLAIVTVSCKRRYEPPPSPVITPTRRHTRGSVDMHRPHSDPNYHSQQPAHVFFQTKPTFQLHNPMQQVHASSHIHLHGRPHPNVPMYLPNHQSYDHHRTPSSQEVQNTGMFRTTTRERRSPPRRNRAQSNHDVDGFYFSSVYDPSFARRSHPSHDTFHRHRYDFNKAQSHHSHRSHAIQSFAPPEIYDEESTPYLAAAPPTKRPHRAHPY